MRTGNFNHTNIGKNGDKSCKIRHFYKCVYYISAKIILVPSASIFVGEWLQRQGHFWAWPLYILFKSDGRHRIHCLVFTDTDFFSLTERKSYLVKQKWRRSTCLRNQCYDVGCHPCNTCKPESGFLMTSPIRTASAKSAKFRWIRPGVYIDDLLW